MQRLLVGLALTLMALQVSWLSVQPAHAVTVQGLYAAQVPLSDRSEAARQDAVLRALQAVLVKVTGRRTVDVLEVLALHDGSVDQLATQADWRDAQGNAAERYWVEFDPLKVNDLLSQSSMPVWGSARSTTALFIVVQGATGRRILSASDDTSLTSRINAVAAQRGIPIILPLMDLRDQRDLNASDVMAGSIDRMEVVSGRYRGEALAYATLSERTDAWDAAWTFVARNDKRSWQQRGRAQQLAEALVHSVADELAARAEAGGGTAPAAAQPAPQGLAAAPQAGNQLSTSTGGAKPRAVTGTGAALTAPAAPRMVMPRAGAGANLAPARSLGGQAAPALNAASGLGITVQGVRSAGDYGALMAYLRGIDVISQVAVLDVQGDVVALDIRPVGSQQAVLQAINGGYTLVPIDGARRYALR